MSANNQTRTVTFRLRRDLDRDLDRLATRRGATRTELLTRFVEEGMRMDEHPGVVFRTGPAGRRPGVIGGPDVWEIARVLRDAGAKGEVAIQRTAQLMGQPVVHVEIATRYYADHREEIDAWIERVDKDAADERESWERRNAILS